jgi:hypothetical protein
MGNKEKQAETVDAGEFICCTHWLGVCMWRQSTAGISEAQLVSLRCENYRKKL